MRRFLNHFGLLALLLAAVGWSSRAAVSAAGGQVSVVLKGTEGTAERLLRQISMQELRAMAVTKLREKGPGGTKAAEWRGPQLKSILDAAMSDLSAESRSRIDLVVLRGADGTEAWIPRAFLIRYPVLLALPGLESIVPESSRPRVRGEWVPYGTYQLRRVQRVELTNFRDHFGKFYLQRRTDPVAVRGEKVFVQTCLSCHATKPELEGWGAWSSDALVDRIRNHPSASGFRKVSSDSSRALLRYWSAYRSQQQGGTDPEKR